MNAYGRMGWLEQEMSAFLLVCYNINPYVLFNIHVLKIKSLMILGNRYLGKREIQRVESSAMDLLSYRKRLGQLCPFCYAETGTI